MLCVLPVFSGDLNLLRENLLWIKKLGGCQNHDALICADAGVGWSDCCELVQLANESFRTTKLISTDETVTGWIPGAVNQFRTAAKWCEAQQRCFWWNESDCWALKPGWLDEIEKAYSQCGQPFMGPIIKSQQPQFPAFFMEGCAVYPANAWSILKDCIKDNEAWITSCANVVVPQAANTPLIIQWWGTENKPMKFVEVKTADSKENEFAVSALRKEGVVFHRCKDLSLRNVLNKRMFPLEPDYSRQTCFVQMGRLGDMILLLPAWQAYAERTGFKTPVVTTREFGTVLEGCSYIQPIMPAGFTWFDAARARRWATSKYGHVIMTQLHGNGLEPKPDNLPSYSWTMWHRTGLLEEYYTLPLVFDQRNKGREEMLIKQWVRGDKPMILTKFSGWTSPFDYINHVKAVLDRWSGVFNIVELDSIHAHRVYDLLGLMDKAALLITVDTFTIHLAAASDVGCVNFVRGDGQSRSMPKNNNLLQIDYHDTPKKIHEIDMQLKLTAAQHGIHTEG